MKKPKGILLFAHNNPEMDYIRFALISGMFAQKHLDVPVSLVTDLGSMKWLEETIPGAFKFFDKVIFTDEIPTYTDQKRQFRDGSQTYWVGKFNNGYRSLCYEFSPYDKTLVIDTDLLIMNDKLKDIWDSNSDFMINAIHYDLSLDRNNKEFKRVSDSSIPFYWATAFYFEKNKRNKIFFKLCQHILENYDYYNFIYQIDSSLVRNDYIFSIAIHIMGGFSNHYVPTTLPCNIYYTLDSDELIEVTDDKNLIFLIEKKNHLGEYTLVKTSNHNVHIMNKYGLFRKSKELLRMISSD
jgi:hypothetical protein